MPPRVFISYSHDNRAHCDRVLALAQQLRRDGIVAELDQFHQCELIHWPFWCEEQMRPENADFVLCVCSAEYQRRVENRVAADVGKGVFWEGALIYNELYDAKGNPRCIPLLLDAADSTYIPRVLQNWTRFTLNRFALDDAGYAQLYALLTGQAEINAVAVGTVVHLPSVTQLERKTDFMQILLEEQRDHEHKSRRRHKWLAAGLLALSLLVGGAYWLIPRLTSEQVIQSFDPALVTERLRTEIQQRYQRDAEAARSQGKTWEALRELEKNRDAALAHVDEVVNSLRNGLADNPGPVFKEASRILQQEGSDAALAYLDSHYRDILSRADQAATLAEHAEQRLQQNLQPLLLQANLHQTRQQWQQALALLQTVAKKAPNWWEARLQLGNALVNLARYSEAEPQLRVAVALAMEEKDQAVASNDLAQLLQTTNRLAEAEPLMRRALAIDEKSLSPDHPDVARDLNNLATLLQDTNRLADAEPLMRRALAIDEKSLGPDHPNVAIGLNNLAQLLQASNRLADAEPLMRRALAIGEKSLGPDHPDVAIDLNNLAGLLQVSNRLANAEPLLHRALAILLQFTHNTGHMHPELQKFSRNYKLLLQAQGLSDAQINTRFAELGWKSGDR